MVQNKTKSMNQELTTYEPIIGIEIHVELATASKMFCGCPADQFGKEPNTQLCPICLGLPGALPVPNKKAVEWTILLGLALGCTVNEESKFDRKHYFYPDLPKGYQISQYDQPLAINGSLELKTQNSKLKTIRIHRVHLEEDTGKLMHATVDGQRVSLVDFNRSGVPLVEIVTEPDFRSVEEVDVFAKKLQQIVRYLGISGADMEKGSMRIEPSVSIRKSQIPNPKSQTISKSKIPNKNKLPAYRVEIKNINSFKFARNAITYEIERQTELLERGEMPTQQTRGFMESKGVTIAQREKEEAHDYRYFPEPDIPPMRFAQSQISNFKSQIGELPDTKRTRFMQEYGLSEYDAGLLVESRKRSDYFEEAVKATLDTGNQAIKLYQISPKAIANWIINKKVDVACVTPAQLLDQIVQATATTSVSDEDLEKIINQVLAENPKAVEDYKNGREQALLYLLGNVRKKLSGTMDMSIVRNGLLARLR